MLRRQQLSATVRSHGIGLDYDGGHACAAGLNLDCSTIEEFLPQLRYAIDKCLKELKE